MAMAGLGRLGLWLHLRRQQSPAPSPATLPPGDGPLLLMRATPEAHSAATQVGARLRRSRRDLRILELGGDIPDPAEDPAAAGGLLDQTRPFALLLLGADLPAGLITAATDRRIPVILGDTHLDPRDSGWSMRAAMRRALLSDMRAIMLTDAASYDIACRMGLPRELLTVTGPVTQIHEPLRCTEAEREGFASLMSGRHAWLAAAIPPSEEAAVLDAHNAALHLSHRALLFLVPDTAERADALAAEIEASGLIVARRTADDEPTEDVQVMISDGPTEMGLWYRLAPVTYMGGTLSGDDENSRNPFEPAALGSAIIHGPATDRFATEWRQLDGGGAARRVSDAAELATAIAELSQPDLTASLASSAWTISTGGVGVAIQIAEPVLAVLREAKP